MTDFEARDLIMALIRDTEHPMSPIIVRDAHDAVRRLNELMIIAGADPDGVHRCANLLLAAVPPDEKETLPITREWIIALGAMLTTSIEGYLNELLTGQSPTGNKR
jgi:hypothetical protein